MSAREYDVAALADLSDGALKTVTIGDQSILLSQVGDDVHAIGAICPHAGGPLGEGVRHGDRVICPWHKATFCLRTGGLLEPPAVDPVARYPVRISDGRVYVTSEPVERSAPEGRTADDARTFVIVGGGAAGAIAAQTLREEGFGGAIVMLDRENRVPYDRTLLSKYLLSGEKGGEKTPLQSQRFYREQDIDRRTVDVTSLDPAHRRITCADGSTIVYDAALIATGVEPVPPRMPGHDLDNVFVLHNRADADSILEQAERSMRVVVLGASFIGMEVAAALRERGLDVTIVAKERTPFAKQLGPEIGRAFTDLHESRGVTFKLGVEIAALDGAGGVERVYLRNGETVPADLVVVGLGVRPAGIVVDGVGRRKDGSFDVDDTLRLAEGLYVAGDIAAFPYQGDRVRVEHWRVAQQHGRIAALNMLGQNVHYSAPPVFWTIQYRKRLDYVGHAATWDDIVIHGDVTKQVFLAYYVKDGSVIAAAGMDHDQDTAALIELFAMRQWTADELGSEPYAVLARLNHA